MSKQASSQTSAEKQAEYRKKYNVMHIGVGPSREEKYQKIQALMEDWNLNSPSPIVWYALDQLLKSPPQSLPQEYTQSRGGGGGQASGFWVTPTTDPNTGVALSFEIIEVEARTDINGAGRAFFRYQQDDAPSRLKALRQAMRSANYDRQLMGFPQSQSTAEETESFGMELLAPLEDN